MTLAVAWSHAGARAYGVSTPSAGRGTKVTTSNGGAAYVGPNGAAAKGAGGSAAVATPRGAAPPSASTGAPRSCGSLEWCEYEEEPIGMDIFYEQPPGPM